MEENKEEVKIVDKWLVESRKENIGRRQNVIVNHYLKSINVATYNDILKNKDTDKYKDKNIVLMFIKPEQVTDNHLREIIKRTYERWHVWNDPLNTNPKAGDKVTQGFYSPSALIELMCEKLEKKYAFIIQRVEK